jgi:Tfp pilus assembly protein PilF
MGKKLPYILAFIVPFIAYSPTLLGTFYYDDNVVFFGHQVKVLAENPLSVFSASTHYLPGAPRSIHVFFLLLIYKAFGAAPLPYHVFNLLLHSGTTLLVFLLLRRIFTPVRVERSDIKGKEPAAPVAPLIGSFLFGLHPIHVESLTFVTLGGTDVFYTFWALLSLMCYIWFRDAALRGPKNYALLVASVLAFYFALLSKESAISFVLVYPLTEFVLRRRGYLWALPHAAVLAFLKRGLVLGIAPAVVREVAQAAPGATAGPAAIIKSLGFFTKSLLVPYPHMPFIKEFGSAPVLYAFAALAVLWLVAGIVFRKRVIAYSALWFAGVSAPYLFVPTVASNVAITAERYIYAPSVAVAFVGAWAVMAASGKERLKSIVKPAAVSILVVYSVLGAVYFYQAWRSEEAFWGYAIKTNPEYVSAYTNLASIELEKGNNQRAKDLLIEGLGKMKGMPTEFAQTAYTLGSIYKGEGDLGRAESYFLQSLRYAGYEFSFTALGFVYLDTGRPERAKWAFEGALKFRQAPRSLVGLALAHFRLGDKQKAGAYAMRAYKLARDPELRAYAARLMKEASK